MDFKRHLLVKNSSIREALVQLNILAKDAILFIVDDNDKLIGSLTDGDVRRGLLKGINIENEVSQIIQPSPRFIRKGERDIQKVIEYRKNNYRIIPILNDLDQVVNVINFREIKSYLPIDAVIMAGGRGERLKPITDLLPKPLLNIGDKPILDHNLDRLALFGIDDFWISINYLGEQILDHLGDGKERNLSIKYVRENKPLGTIGAVSKIKDLSHDYILVTNSDILTNIDYEQFFIDFLNHDSDFSVVTIPYKIDIPYAVLETESGVIKSFKEKPTYTYYANGGIYLMKRAMLGYIPHDTFYNTTDLLEDLIAKNYKITSFPLLGYWRDIGRFEDLEKAKIEIQSIQF